MVLKEISHWTKRLSVTAICACIIFVIVIIGRNGAKGSSKTFEYTALGDSIPHGYTVSEDDSLKGYPRLLTEDMEKQGIPVNFSEYTENGLTTDGLCEAYLSDKKVQKDMKDADLITVTIGANDLLKKFRELYRDIFDGDTKVRDMNTVLETIQEKAMDNPKLLAEAAEIIYGWNCDDFEMDWKKAMESIRQNRDKDAQVIVTTIYNPAGDTEAPGILSQMIDGLIGKMNQIIIENSAVYGYQAVDLSEAGIEKHLQSDGLHPDRQGQQMIMEKIKEKYLG